MDQREIEDLIIELLAEEAGVSPAEMRAQLEEGGGDLPIDSVLAAEVVARVERRCGVELPATAETAQCLRSVRQFAAMMWRLVAASQGRASGEGA